MEREQTGHQAVTLADVAKAAGVSLATASKALADRYDVAANTKERVLKAAEELAFSPNMLARGLLGGRTQSVGIITNDMDGRFAPSIMKGAEDALGADSSNVIMCNSQGDPELELHHAKALLGRRVDGLLVVGDEPEPRTPLKLHTQTPVVYVYAPCDDPAAASFVCDNVETARIATRALISSGHRRIAHLGGPPTATAAIDRARGVQAAVEDNGLELLGGGPIWGDWTQTWGWDATAKLLDSQSGVDALVCGDDQIARGARELLEARGLRVPEDVALVGFDNWAVLSAVGRHPFSSMDMNLVELGRAAARAVAQHDLSPGVIRLPGKLVDRGTTG
ncbi:LacI family DNA-binding transcriptional regulator [Pseudarthrobacter phenanthrenivorans]|uniref:LacI family DNA-binding transcriptional regulator n=1 Tax=Pseudarthrobacter phenanthrenivorans TaxID=361575 RepID=UPI00344B1E31